MMVQRGFILGLFLVVHGCGLLEAPEGYESRGKHNRALKNLENRAWEQAAKGFLEARDEAGPDPDLRFSAAFNLGMAHAGHAGELMESEAEDALEQLNRSAAWFRDAVRLRPTSEDARVNLEIVLRRTQILIDQLNKGKNGLEARLDRLLDDQRSARDQVRQLMERVRQEVGAGKPLRLKEDFEIAATQERTLLSDAGTIGDMAGSELSLIEGKGEEERSDEERGRLVQLKNLDFYLQRGRNTLADARRALRRLLTEQAHKKADEALSELKRAREQLQDPVTVLRGVLEDQTVLMMHTEALDVLSNGGVTLKDGEVARPPVWLTSEHLGARQQTAAERTSELNQRFAAGLSATSSAAETDPKARRVREAVEEAIPLMERALSSMSDSQGALASNGLAVSVDAQRESAKYLAFAIERFADSRSLIELLYAEQKKIGTLLSPDSPPSERQEQLSPEERRTTIIDSTSWNRERLARLKFLLEDDLAEALAQASQEGAAEAQEAEKKRFEMAQTLRSQADDDLTNMQELFDGRGRDATQLRERSTAAEEKIEELRRLFFSVIEHLKELLANQTETHDRTASAKAVAEDGLAEALGPLVDPQRRHAAMGDAIAAALEEQADAAAQDPSNADAAAKLSEAAPEVRAGSYEMTTAADLMAEGRDTAQASSYDLEPTLSTQQKAIQHLENALQILQPPQQQEGGEDQQQEQQQGQQEEQEQEFSKKQAEQRLQAIRDQEAERSRERRRAQARPDPVEKDW